MKLNFKNKKVFIIAEAGVNHNGKLKNALALVDVAVNAKADAIKFQTFLPGELTGNYTPKVKYMRETKYKRSLLTKKLALSFSKSFISSINLNSIMKAINVIPIKNASLKSR